MKKTFLILTVFFSVISPPVLAAPNSVPQQCEQLFKETESLINQAERQPGTHIQVNKIKKPYWIQ